MEQRDHCHSCGSFRGQMLVPYEKSHCQDCCQHSSGLPVFKQRWDEHQQSGWCDHPGKGGPQTSKLLPLVLFSLPFLFGTLEIVAVFSLVGTRVEHPTCSELWWFELYKHGVLQLVNASGGFIIFSFEQFNFWSIVHCPPRTWSFPVVLKVTCGDKVWSFAPASSFLDTHFFCAQHLPKEMSRRMY